ncbi:hypothetical protein JCM33374_g4474 [Metschnikowia sp. JCM 33374]|nr:hypothetical protein JCM33374_g4474 [Metschnikowia sp. JCM 33374]
MFKRKTRNSTAYTGVGLPSPSAQAPDNGAMAAALSIGKTLKQTRPEVYGKPNGSPSMTRYGPPKHTSSLLKRNSSFQNSIESTGSPTPRSRTGSNLSSRHSMAPTFNRQVYNVDDSFNDSFFEEVGHETDAHYSNEARLRDLKLHHQPPAPKMVKKYIPTPNGITVIEVPEESMKKEIARSNSMRTGLSINRAGSLRSGRSHSMTNAAKAKKPNRSRLSSMVNAPRIDEQSELDYQSAQSSRLVSRDSAELDELDRQIEHEKQLAEKLEQKRREYERLKKLRAENERKLRELQKLQEAETSSFKDMSSTFEEDLVSPVHNEKEVSSDLHGQSEPQAHPQKSPQVHSQKQQPQPQPQPQQQQPQPQTQSKAVGPNGSQAPHAELSESEEEDVPIAPLPFAVDELDSKKFTIASQPNGEGPRHDSQASIDTAEGVNEFVPQSTSPHDTVVNSYGDTFVAPKESDTSAVREDSTDNFGIEEVPTEAFESPNLASQLRPNFAPRRDSGAAESHTSAVSNISGESSAFPEDSSRQGSTPFFDPVPEIIGTYERDSPKLEATTGTTDDTLVPPPTLAGSIRSFSSLDSKSKPIKSAMKNKRPSYTSTTSAKESPAHQAYLSLTTAENTRLNSKLSASHLPEPNLGPESKPQPKIPQQSKENLAILA